ncbi:hypothetical protein Q6312_29570, partial [Klebsiella pneumoniae]|uniref:hypothetical protein n=1 Tax=Klebsiella pneumoniae TaxID=573 RepID=UPI00272FBD8D
KISDSPYKEITFKNNKIKKKTSIKIKNMKSNILKKKNNQIKNNKITLHCNKINKVKNKESHKKYTYTIYQITNNP